MFKKLKKIKENKIFKVIYNVLYALFTIAVVLILLAVILQRVSNNTLSLGGFRIFNIVTGSMVPKYQVGDTLLAKSIEPSKIKVGDDVVYQGAEGTFNGKIVTHQVIAIEEENGVYKFHTKGIANTDEDPVVSQEQIMGKVIYNIKTIGYITKLINNLYSFYFIIFIPMAILIFLEIKRIAFPNKDDEEEEEEILDDNKKEDVKEKDE